MAPPRERPGSRAAYAPNWRRVLLADAVLGALVAAAGLGLVVFADNAMGWVAFTLGLIYVFAIIGRYRTWRLRRREAGLDD